LGFGIWVLEFLWRLIFGAWRFVCVPWGKHPIPTQPSEHQELPLPERGRYLNSSPAHLSFVILGTANLKTGIWIALFAGAIWGTIDVIREPQHEFSHRAGRT
jgi:hypothetical protein